MSKTIVVERHRRADNGQYCTEAYAERHKNTTITEHRKERH